MVVRSQPVVARQILCRGVDITQFQCFEAQHLLYILVDAITIGRNPHTAVLVKHQALGRILTQGCLVKLIVEEVLHLLGLRVDDI